MRAKTGKPLISEFLLPLAERSEPLPSLIGEAIHAVRSHLGMDVAFVSEFANGRRYFRNVDGAGADLPIRVGDSDLLEDGYCQRVVDGRLPELIRDAGALPEAAALAVTHELPVGAHLSVPIRLADGSVYGTFCCFSYRADQSLNDRDLQVMRAFAEVTSRTIEKQKNLQRQREDKSERIRRVFDQDQLSPVFQPIFNLDTGRIAGVEALARFSGALQRGPDVWFAEAAEVGWGAEMELLSIRKALDQLSVVPDGVYMTLNVSPSTVLGGKLDTVLNGRPLERLGLEITEHAAISDYLGVKRILQPLRKRGLMLAVDDVGAGYSSLRHILTLKPDLIKLDIGLIRSINRDPDRRAMASALIAFSHQTGSRIVAEGVETAQELSTLRKLGAEKAQGYLLGRPMPVGELGKLHCKD
jgi:EAL domain-containing protein (putative c-di-GMP-specific phosphodiesterase class I)